MGWDPSQSKIEFQLDFGPSPSIVLNRTVKTVIFVATPIKIYGYACELREMLIEQIIEFELRGSGPFGRICAFTTGYFHDMTKQKSRGILSSGLFYYL